MSITTYGNIDCATERAVKELMAILECCGVHPAAAEDMARDHIEGIKEKTLDAMGRAWPRVA